MSDTRTSKVRSGPFAAVQVSFRGDVFVIRLLGALDQGACRELEDALGEAEASDATLILLDVDRLQELDAAALHVILKASRRSVGDGNRLKITRGKGYVANIFRLTSLDRTLPFVDERQSISERSGRVG